MALLPERLRAEIRAVLGHEAPFTDLEFVRMAPEQIRASGPRATDSFIRLKTHIFQHSADRFRPAVSFEPPAPLPTSVDRLFGGPLCRGEVTSIEGGSGAGKTRLALRIAHDISIAGRALFVDADLALQPNILAAMQASLGLENAVPPSFSIEEESSLTILPVNSIGEFRAGVNGFLSACRPDLIVIDSLMSLFQSVLVNDGPGSALLQETALELKHLAREINCVVVVTNVLKHDSHPPQPFLGRLYASLWHQRLLMTTKNYLAVKCELVQSPRYPYQSGKIMIENLIDCPEDHIAAFEGLD
jgi:hypothetical protein